MQGQERKLGSPTAWGGRLPSVAVPGPNPRILPGWRLRAGRSEHVPRCCGGGARKRPCRLQLGAWSALPSPPAFFHQLGGRGVGRGVEKPRRKTRLSPLVLWDRGPAQPASHTRRSPPLRRPCVPTPADFPRARPTPRAPSRSQSSSYHWSEREIFAGPSAQPGSRRGRGCRVPIFLSPLGVAKEPTAAGP